MIKKVSGISSNLIYGVFLSIHFLCLPSWEEMGWMGGGGEAEALEKGRGVYRENEVPMGVY